MGGCHGKNRDQKRGADRANHLERGELDSAGKALKHPGDVSGQEGEKGGRRFFHPPRSNIIDDYESITKKSIEARGLLLMAFCEMLAQTEVQPLWDEYNGKKKGP
jgi:hypothetical protein